MVANGCYHFEMYVNLTNTCQYTTDAIGVYFSDTAITGITNFYPLALIPNISNAGGNVFDTINWTLVAGEYMATGNETHLIIGNFKDDANTNIILVNNSAPFDFVYALVDHVSLNQCKATITENAGDATSAIYPNPVSDRLHIEISINEDAEIILYDGAFKKMVGKKFQNATTLDMQSLAAGIYFYEIRISKNIYSRGKIVKQ